MLLLLCNNPRNVVHGTSMLGEAASPFSGTDNVSTNREGDIVVSEKVHPEYGKMIGSWKQWRLGYEAGDKFVEKFLKKYSKREDATTFKERKEITYVPAHAKGAINTVKNGIFQRMTEVVRTGGAPSYATAITGENGGVDLKSKSMNAFMGRNIISELLVQGKVGIYIDNQRFEGQSRAAATQSRPYLYWYQAESILNWAYDRQGQLTRLLLADTTFAVDDVGLPTEEVQTFRFLERTVDGVQVTILRDDTTLIDQMFLKIKRIPFVIFELTQGMMKDIFMHQVALLNAASSDISYITKSNFPFYTEQYDPRLVDNVRRSEPAATGDEGEAVDAGKSKKAAISVGVATGRRYVKDTERPQFIHPSDIPVRASMEKQKQIKEEIRQLVDLSLSNIQMKSASAESKKQDNAGLEAGLSAVGLSLETGETEIAEIWTEYENKGGKQVIISYPRTYAIKSEGQRLEDAKEKKELKNAVPSLTFKKELAKSMAKDLLEFRVPAATLTKIFNEIDSANIVQSDVEFIAIAHKEGLLDDEGAASALCFPKGTVEKAQKDHAARIARIQDAQSSDTNQARGLTDTATNPNAGKDEKEIKDEETN